MPVTRGQRPQDEADDLIQWPTFSIEDTLASANDHTVQADEDSWGAPRELISWAAPRFTLIEKQRATRFWTPNEQQDTKPNKSPHKIAEKESKQVTLWRRRREDLPLYLPAPDLLEEAETSDDAANIDKSQSRGIDPGTHFSRVLDPEDFMQNSQFNKSLVEHKNGNTLQVSAKDDLLAIIQDDLSPLQQECPLQKETLTIPATKAGRAVQKLRWRPTEMHLLDGIAANCDYLPLTPLRAGDTTSQGEQNHSMAPDKMELKGRQEAQMDSLMDSVAPTISWDVLQPSLISL